MIFREAKKSKYAESSGEEEQSEESEEEEEEEVKPKKGRGRRNDQGSNKRGRPSRSAACKRGSYGKFEIDLRKEESHPLSKTHNQHRTINIVDWYL